MCKRGNRRSRRICNYRTRVWVNQYNNVEYNWGTVTNVSKGVDECESENDQPVMDYCDSPDVAVQVVNVQKNEQPSSCKQESNQEPGVVSKNSKVSFMRNFAIGGAIGVAIGGVLLFINKQKMNMNTNMKMANAPVAGVKAQQSMNGVVGSKSQNLMVLVEKAAKKGGINSAIEMLMSKALNDDPEVVYFLSKLYMNEEVVKGEYETGWHFLMWSAAHGVINAIVDVAAIALRSVETSEDAKVAFSWIHEAASLGHPECESILSSFYAAGFGCKRNMKLAHMWMLKAQIDNYNQELALQILGANEKVNK